MYGNVNLIAPAEANADCVTNNELATCKSSPIYTLSCTLILPSVVEPTSPFTVKLPPLICTLPLIVVVVPVIPANALLSICNAGCALPFLTVSVVPGPIDVSCNVVEPLIVWLPTNTLEPVVANEPVSISILSNLVSTDAEYVLKSVTDDDKIPLPPNVSDEPSPLNADAVTSPITFTDVGLELPVEPLPAILTEFT